MDAPRLTRYPTTDGKEGWAKEVGNLVMPASSDEVAMWKETERLRIALAHATELLRDVQRDFGQDVLERIGAFLNAPDAEADAHAFTRRYGQVVKDQG